MRDLDLRPNRQSLRRIEPDAVSANGNIVIDDLERAVIHANDFVMLVREHSNEGPPVETGGSQSRTIFASTVASQYNAGSLYSQLSGDVEFTPVQ